MEVQPSSWPSADRLSMTPEVTGWMSQMGPTPTSSHQGLRFNEEVGEYAVRPHDSQFGFAGSPGAA